MAAAWGSALSMIGARRGGFLGGLLATFGATIALRAAMGRHDFAHGATLAGRAAERARLAREGHRVSRVGRVVSRQRCAVVDADRGDAAPAITASAVFRLRSRCWRRPPDR